MYYYRSRKQQNNCAVEKNQHEQTNKTEIETNKKIATLKSVEDFWTVESPRLKDVKECFKSDLADILTFANSAFTFCCMILTDDYLSVLLIWV